MEFTLRSPLSPRQAAITTSRGRSISPLPYEQHCKPPPPPNFAPPRLHHNRRERQICVLPASIPTTGTPCPALPCPALPSISSRPRTAPIKLTCGRPQNNNPFHRCPPPPRTHVRTRAGAANKCASPSGSLHMTTPTRFGDGSLPDSPLVRPHAATPPQLSDTESICNTPTGNIYSYVPVCTGDEEARRDTLNGQ